MKTHFRNAFSPRFRSSAYAQRHCRKRRKECERTWWSVHRPQRAADTSSQKRAEPVSQCSQLIFPHSSLAQVTRQRRFNSRRRTTLWGMPWGIWLWKSRIPFSPSLSILVPTVTASPEVELCGYSIPHPSEAKMNLRIQTYGMCIAVLADFTVSLTSSIQMAPRPTMHWRKALMNLWAYAML